jgi:hypothetical protein
MSIFNEQVTRINSFHFGIRVLQTVYFRHSSTPHLLNIATSRTYISKTSKSIIGGIGVSI